MAPIIYFICLLVFILLLTLVVLIYLLSVEMPSFKTIYNTLGRDVKAAYLYFKTLSFVKRCNIQNRTVLSLFRDVVKKHRNKVCFVFEDEEWTYEMVDELSNKIANVFLSHGYGKGDEVALFMENCPEYACMWLGLAKIGVITALINTNLREETLGHSINVIDAKAVIFGRNFANVIKDGIPFLNKKDTLEYYAYTNGKMSDDLVPFPAKSLNLLLEEASTAPIDPKKVKINMQDKMLYIYTSGTTGLPKAAIIRHTRFLFIGVAAKYISQLSEFETFYNTLPMYHTAGGVVFVSVVFIFGGKMVIRKKFSASNFWKEAIKHKATVSQYIGEICRFLLNQPKTPEETQHSIKLMFGNGLRPHIWKEFQDRFKIPHIIEIYGATEGNANIVNMFGKVGAVGFIPRYCNRLYPACLIKVDPETGIPVRNSKGFCIRCQPGEPGEMVGKIINSAFNSFDGYVNQNDTKKKIINDCFERGDRAFLSGDILVMDEDGYLYFMDRTGDTFRWRGENVSTGEVENMFSKALGLVACVVYGVEIPKAEGRAGMVAVQTDVKTIHFSELYKDACKRLPSYALPVFIRVSSDIEATGTYKLRKVTLQNEGYNPEEIADPLFFLDRKQQTYVPLTKDLYSDIVSGRVNL